MLASGRMMMGRSSSLPVRQSSSATVKLAEPLPQDIAAGSERVWCVSILYSCISCTDVEFRTCGTNRLVRQVDGEWQIFKVTTDEEKDDWEARGCELMPETTLDF